MALPSPGTFWRLARKVEELFEFQGKVRDSLSVIEQRLRALEDRMMRIEAEERQLVTEAKSAAAAAATGLASAILSDAVTRITRLEGRAERIEEDQQRRRLPPP